MRGLLAALFACVASGCASVDLARYATLRIEPAAVGATAELDYQGIPLRSGQVIVSEMDTPVSLLITLMADDYRPWIHAGVISVEDGDAYVYEAFGTLRPRFGGPPTEAMGGNVRRITLARYLSRQAVAAVYAPPGPAEPRAVAVFARNARRDKLAFDPWFDARTANAVYCTEFVARALEYAGVPPIVRSPRNDNGSLAAGLAWLGIDAPEFILAAALIEDARPVALLSSNYSPDEIDARFAIKRELHRRFTPDQRLGNLFRWTLTGPELRERVVAAIGEALDAGRDAGALAAVLDRKLGPFPEPAPALSARGRAVETPPSSTGDGSRPRRH